MANQWALIIGINQYKAIQPLMYAQPDAVGLRNFFVDELGVSVHSCTLLTDISAAVEPHAYMPLRDEIEHQLQTLCRDRVQPDDLLWVFFSGYGLAEGGQDYWMTLDSEPGKLADTGIPLTRIFEILGSAKTDQIVLAMDMNRSQGAIGHRDIGAQTLTLAKDYGITTFLSCQPEQFSHETMYVRHGLFTKALLEGLRYHGCITASQLAAYVGDRVPELCEHHCRPRQDPVVVMSPAQKFMMVVPADGINNLSVTENDAANLGLGLAAVPPANETVITTPPLINQPITPLPAPLPAPTPGTSPSFEIESNKPPTTIVTPTLPGNSSTKPEVDAPDENAIVPRPTNDEDDEDPQETALPISGIWKWGGLLAALAFLAGVFARYQPALFGGGEFLESSEGPALVETTELEADAAEETPPVEGEAPAAAATGDGSEGSPLFPADIDPIERGETALQRADEAIANNRFGEARAWLSQVPPELQDNTYQSLLQQANSEVAEAAVRNQDILTSARQIIQPNSASMFNDAIEQARQVPPDDPYYEQAQEDIRRWGRVILDLAEGRAAGGDINGAIAAARLVPEDQPEVSTLASQRIQTWERQLANQELIREAQALVQPGQASSYNDAIRLLSQIMPDQPGYATAQARTTQWSEDILAIARARAAQGDLSGAIAAARLVPEETATHSQAIEEIQRWESQQ